MKRLNQTDARIMLVQTIPRNPTPPPPETVDLSDVPHDWQKSNIYEEILVKKGLKYFKDAKGKF